MANTPYYTKAETEALDQEIKSYANSRISNISQGYGTPFDSIADAMISPLADGESFFTTVSDKGQYIYASATEDGYILDHLFYDVNTGTFDPNSEDVASQKTINGEINPIKINTNILLDLNLSLKEHIKGDSSVFSSATSIASSTNNWVKENAFVKETYINEIRYRSANSTDLKIRAFSKSGDVFTLEREVIIDNVVTDVDTTVSINPLLVKVGEYIGYQGAGIYYDGTVNPSDQPYENNYFGGGDSFTDASPTFPLPWDIEYIGGYSTIEENKENIDGNIQNIIENNILLEQQYNLLGVDSTDSVSTTTFSKGSWISNRLVTKDGYLSKLRVNMIGSGTAKAVVYSQPNGVGTALVVRGEESITLVDGDNTINNLTLEIFIGDRIGIDFTGYSGTGLIYDNALYSYDGQITTGGSTFYDFGADWAFWITSKNITKDHETRITDNEFRGSTSINLPFKNMMIIGSGQSLMNGIHDGSSPITTTQEYDTLGFNPSNQYEVLPATADNTSTSGEWSGLGCAKILRELIMRENNSKYSDAKSTIVISNTGQNGATIEEISKGGSSSKFEVGVNQSERLSLDYEKAGVIAIIFMQGESNSTDTADAYEAKLIQLANDYNTDIKTATGQSIDVKLFTYQLSTNANLPPAYIQAHNNSKLVICSHPMYQLVYTDSLHIGTEGERIVGGYFAKAIHQESLQGNSFEPLMCDSVRVIGNSIVLKMNKRGLVFDAPLEQFADNGFYVKDGATSKTIVSTTIINSNEVKITMSEAPQDGWTVGYGVTQSLLPYGLGGNLRDNDGANWSIDGFDLHNWCLLFSLTL